MKNSGFTMIEVLLSVALLAIVAGFSIVVFNSFYVRNDLDIAAVEIAQSLRRAQLLAQASDGNGVWGVKVQAGGLFIFKGADFDARDPAFDEFFSVPSSIVPTGLSKIVFAKFSGLPDSTGAIILTSNTNEIKNITINAKGMVDY
jgi:prepilin-type N-terminal cleavage/methylation domain-containing protein